ncbi:hypothetical protein pipiens_001423 [Culex pipiens pipiens]|uniref:Reverse transcriptase n=1 Tax=Culex pipiens pipiens TaxID=38569 RepID=A0ABD1CW02_CULPP
MSEFKVRVHTLKFAFGQGSQEPSDAEMFGFCRDWQMPPNEIYSIHRDTQAKAIFVKFKSERQMKAVKDKLQPFAKPSDGNGKSFSSVLAGTNLLPAFAKGDGAPPMIMTLLQSNRNQQLVSDTMDVGVPGTEPTLVQLTPPPSSPAPAQPSLPITPAQPSLPISPAQPSLPISPPVPMGPPQAPVLPEGSARKPRNKFRRGTEGKGEAIPQVPAGGSVTLVQKLRSRSRSERRPHDNAGQDQAGKGRSASRSDQQEVTAESDADFVEVLPRNSSANIGAGLKDMVSALQLKDAGQEKGCTGFTFHRCDSASRLDRFYVSRDFLDTILEVKNVAVAFSDHHAVVLKFEVDPQHLCRRGRGYWKLNPAFLKDDSISNRFLVEYEGLRARPVHLMNRSIWWNHVVKKKITWFYQEQGRLFNRRISSAKSTQYQKLNELAVDLGNGLDVRAEIAIVKSRLMEMECQRLQYLGNKLSGTSLIENEKMNIFHVSNQVHRFSASSSFKLLDDGALTDDQDRLKAIIQGFYSNCFMNDPLQADEGVVAEALGSVSKTLSVEQANQMLRPISEDELKSTSLAAAKKKSPGPDGLSYEFYLTLTFDIVKEDLLKLFNGYLDGSLKPPKEFSAGIITLIPKEADAASLDKYRPISMLNTDYKLFTKILANRLHAKNVLYGKDGEEKKDLSLLKFGKKDVLGRNTKDWLVEAEELGSSYTLNTVRLLYCYHVDQRRTVPKIEEKLTDLDWENLWNNLSHNFLTSDSRSTLFLLYNDLLLNKDKLYEYKIGRVADNICEICGKKDNNFHRLRECDASQDKTFLLGKYKPMTKSKKLLCG